MIKSPIANTGELRYIEIIKIVVLVSFFYAFMSFVTDQPHLVTSSVSKYVLLGVYGVLLLSFVVMSVNDLMEFYVLVKSFIIRIIFKPVVIVYDYTVTTVRDIIVQLNEQKNHLKLCVIRC